MANFAALKVKIGLKPDGSADYPNFGSLASVQASGLDWSRYIDTHGKGWMYDKSSGHNDDDVDSPAGQQWGLLVVPEAFATEAVAAFPATCERITEAALEAFHDARCTAHIPEDQFDESLVNSLANAYQSLLQIEISDPLYAGLTAGQKNKITSLRQSLAVRLVKALDPDDVEPGRKRNLRKLWATRRVKEGVTVVDP